MRGCGNGGALAVALAIVVAVLVPALVRAQATDPFAWDVPCGDRWAFVAGVAELGGSFEGYDVAVRVAPTEAGAFVGRLSIELPAGARAIRELEDANCADVVDALVIAAALTLRSLPPPAPRARVVDRPPVPATDDEMPPALSAPVAAPSSPPPRIGFGASFRVGLGPVPGVAIAPVLAVALEIERVVVALHVAYWPVAGATLEDGRRGVVVGALASTLELGYRLGDEVSFVPSLAIEPSVALARGVGVASPRDEAVFVLDGGASAALSWDVGAIRLFVRADVLFALVQPVYGVEGERVFVGPTVRGTGGAGLFAFF